MPGLAKQTELAEMPTAAENNVTGHDVESIAAVAACNW